MKSLLLATTALVLSAGIASAADLAAKPYVKAPIVPMVYDWSGWYVGVNGGWGQSSEHWQYSDFSRTFPSFTASGGTAGGQFGWRTQTSQLVWGFDISGNWADFTGQQCGNFACLHTQVQAYETLAVTAGYAFNNVLLYVRGGTAAIQSQFQDIHGGVLAYSNTGSRWDGLLGAGLEYGLTPNWTIGVQYDHIFGGSQNIVLNGVNGGSNAFTTSQTLDIVTARINYKFGGPVIARY